VSSISTELDDFYQKIGIAKDRFVCKNAEFCGEVCSNGGQRRIGPFGSSIGGKYRRSRYKSEGVPGLVFLSQGPVISDDELKCAEDTNKDISKSAKDHDDFMNCPAHQESVNNPHWRSTKDHGLSILAANGLPSITREVVAQHICNVNSVKCRTSASRTKDPDKGLFGYCQEHIISELEELEPDIIVAQGNRAWDVLLRGAQDNKFNFLNRWPISLAVEHDASHDKQSLDDVSYELDLSSVASQNTRWNLSAQLETKKSEVVILRFNNKPGKTCLCLWTHHSSYGHHNRKISSRGVTLANGDVPSHKDFNIDIHPLIVKLYLDLLARSA